MDNQETEEKTKLDEEKAGDDLNNQINVKKEHNETLKEECDTSKKRTHRQGTGSSSQKEKPAQQTELYVPKKNGERIL